LPRLLHLLLEIPLAIPPPPPAARDAELQSVPESPSSASHLFSSLCSCNTFSSVSSTSSCC
jgi:hypothetical protein